MADGHADTLVTMTSWSTFEAEAPDLAAPIRAAFESHLHHVVATLRRDGSPRVSGNEVRFAGDDVWLGMMPKSAKAADLRRDPRVAVHAAPVDTTLSVGDAKFSGRALEVGADEVAWFLREIGNEMPSDDACAFRIDLTGATLTTVRGEIMIVQTWHPGQGTVREERS